jgi:hypothetical protein
MQCEAVKLPEIKKGFVAARALGGEAQQCVGGALSLSGAGL